MDQECEADDCPCLYVWKVTKTKRAVTKFSSEVIPKNSRGKLAQELDRASSGQPHEDSGTNREKEQQRFLDGTPSSNVLQSVGNTGPSLEDWPWGSEVCGPPQRRVLCNRESGRRKFRRVTIQKRKPGGVGVGKSQ